MTSIIGTFRNNFEELCLMFMVIGFARRATLEIVTNTNRIKRGPGTSGAVEPNELKSVRIPIAQTNDT